MTGPAAALRRAADHVRADAAAVTGARWDGVWLLRLAAPDVLVEPWAGVLDDVADLIETAA